MGREKKRKKRGAWSRYPPWMPAPPHHANGHFQRQLDLGNGAKMDLVRIPRGDFLQTGEPCALPGETQWEYACRAGTATPLWFGGLESDFAKCANLADHSLRAMPTYGWGLPSGAVPPWRPAVDSGTDKFRIAAPAGSFEPNAWDLCDMSGNVWEWTGGDFDPDRKAVRGGSWSDRPCRATSASRLGYRPWQRVYHVGFRVMLAASVKTTAAVSRLGTARSHQHARSGAAI